MKPNAVREGAGKTGRKPARAATPETIVPAASIAGPPHGALWAALTYAVLTMSLGFPALAGKFLVGPNSDQYIAGYAFREFAASTLRATGHFPQWEPYLFGGMPFVAAMHGDIFYPTFLLRLILPTDVAMTWGFIIHVFLAGLFTFLFLRATGFGFFGSLFGGVAYMMSGQVASLVSPGHDGKLFVSALFPLTLWMLVCGIRDGKRWSWGVLAIVIGLAVLSPHPQVLQYLLLASAAYAIFLTVSAVKRNDITSREATIRLGCALGAVVLGGLMGAIQYLPVREYVAWSPRAGGLADYARATSYAWPPNELFNSYLPQFTGILESYWGESGIHFHSDYIGAVVLVLAGAAFGGLGANPRKREIWFWTGVLIVATLWALGGHTPFYRIPYAIIPGTKFFRAPNSVFFVGSIAIAFLSAAGVERAMEGKVGRKYLYGWLGLATVIVLMASTGMLTSIAESLAAEQMVDRAIANSLHLMIGAWRSFAFVVLAVALLLAMQRQKIPVKVAAWGITLLAAVDLWTILRFYWTFSAPAAQLYATNPAIEYLKHQPQPQRVIALQLGYPVRDPDLTGDGLMIHRVRNVLGYHGNQLGRYDRLLHREEGYSQLLNPNAWQLLNARFILADDEVARFFPKARKVVGPVKDAAGVTVNLFELPGVNPYSWVVPVIVKADDEAVLNTVLDQRFDIRRAGLFDSASSVAGVNKIAALPEPLTTQTSVAHYEAGKVSVHLDSPAPRGSALIVSENYYPGWQATVNGKLAPTARADFSLIGVQLPEGARDVELTFTSAAYEKGKIVTLIAIAIALVLAGAGFFAERKSVV
jgi:Bacterial membrane protein YfhO